MANLLTTIHENLSSDPEPIIDLMLQRAYQVFPDEYQIDDERLVATLYRICEYDPIAYIWFMNHGDLILSKLRSWNAQAEAAGLESERELARSLGAYVSRYGFN